MKPIKASRFTKKRPEEISFQAEAILENIKTGKRRKTSEKRPKNKTKRKNVRTDIRTTVRTNERTVSRGLFRYQIEVPQTRRKVRHSFDIFEDQKSALEKLQLAVSEKEGAKPSMGEMVQQAIDLYTKQKTKRLGNVELIMHNKEVPERTNERSNT